jgi:rod shape-determining protein MreB
MARDLGIDLGTANVLVYVKGKGIIIDEPSVVSIDIKSNKVVAVGSQAKEMLGRTPGSIVATRPLKSGVIADFKVTEEMLKYFIKKSRAHVLFSLKPRVIICIPSGVTQVERRAVIEATVNAGAREKDTYLIEEPMAAAIGCGLPVEEPIGNMIIDIGGGTSEMAVISLGGIVASNSLRIAGDVLNEHILNYVKKKYNVAIGERTSEKIKINIANVFEPDEKNVMEIRGRDLLNGLPKVLNINSLDVYEAIKEPISGIIDTIKLTLEKTPPELSADVIETGITLAGGGALIGGLDKLIEIETGIKVKVSEEPLKAVVRGTSVVLENMDFLKNILQSSY